VIVAANLVKRMLPIPEVLIMQVFIYEFLI
jgi:hypothetical protein